ncbi:MAG: DoxX family membrane protein [Thermoplasmata archaeon]|nr:DoxX family membrane protein [Thermoplasmata archaeon]
MEESTGTTVEVKGWWPRNAQVLKTLFRMLFGFIWVIDGSLKFAPGFVGAFAGSVSGDGQPAWLQGWFTFWANAVNGNTAFWVYLTGSLELALGLALLFGFMRKIAYVGGALLSLFIWAVPEGFGGPYGPGSTDIGTGAMYSLLFLSLILINATYGPSKWSLDYQIEKRFPRWAAIAEFQPRAKVTAEPVAGKSATT